MLKCTSRGGRTKQMFQHLSLLVFCATSPRTLASLCLHYESWRRMSSSCPVRLFAANHYCWQAERDRHVGMGILAYIHLSITFIIHSSLSIHMRSACSFCSRTNEHPWTSMIICLTCMCGSWSACGCIKQGAEGYQSKACDAVHLMHMWLRSQWKTHFLCGFFSYPTAMFTLRLCLHHSVLFVMTCRYLLY